MLSDNILVKNRIEVPSTTDSLVTLLDLKDIQQHDSSWYSHRSEGNNPGDLIANSDQPSFRWKIPQ